MNEKIEELRDNLARKRIRVKERYRYYEQKNSLRYMSKLMPPEYRWMSAKLGWCTKAVDSLADRLTVTGFRNDTFNIGSIFKVNNQDILFDSAILNALISSCSFVYIRDVGEGIPKLQVVTGGNATGEIDENTGLLTIGYAVLERDKKDGKPIVEALFEPDKTTFLTPAGKYTVPNPTGVPLLVPIINRPDAGRPFGHSRISRACMNTQDDAARTIIRSAVSSEFYSFPQKYILGLSEENEFNGSAATMSNFFAITKDEDGDRPQVGQFSQQSMQPHLDQLKSLASLFGGETGLTLDDLGFAGSNPMSAEAIKATHESMRGTARKAQHHFGIGFVNVGYVAAALRDGIEYKREAFADTSVAWRPLFEPDSSQLGVIGDAILKIEQALPGYLTEEKLIDLLGF